MAANMGLPLQRMMIDKGFHGAIPSPSACKNKNTREIKTASRSGSPRRLALVVGTLVVSLAAAIAYAINRDAPRTSAAASPPAPAASPSSSSNTPPAQVAAADAHAHAPAAQPARAARTAEEEAYIRALWPIHGDVERSAMRLSMGQIFYATQDLPRTELKARVEGALKAFEGAEGKLAALAPPPSLKPDHDTYLAGVRLFKDAAVEIRKMFADGKDDHMRAAYPRSQEASDKIRDVGGKLWPHEFPPH